jgi:DNA-directed RNA polymerase specialized sigma subunit
MIRTESDYQEALSKIRSEKARMLDHKKRLQNKGLNRDQVETALEPMESFHLQLVEEVEAYERLKRGDLGELKNLHGLGRMLIGMRIAKGFTQTDLAKLLGVDVSQVSRDERNEYHGVTVERATRILDALNVELLSRTGSPVLPEEGRKRIA